MTAAVNPHTNRSAEEFLRTTDVVYEECANGLATLDRIIVSVNSSLADHTRSYLVPLVYAYWERFFKMTFAEFLRCVTLRGITAMQLNSNLAQFLLKVKINDALKNSRIGRIQELAGKQIIEEAKQHYDSMHSWFSAPLQLLSPANLVETESNVKYEVLDSNCKNFGIDIQGIKAHTERAGKILFVQLNELVTFRNQIAHGEVFHPVTSEKWQTFKEFVLDLMNATQIHLYETLTDDTKMLRPVSS